MTNIVIPLAIGFEEIEAITLVDILRRAQLNVQTVSLDKSLEVSGAHHIKVLCDKYIYEIDSDNIDMLLLPGGGGGTDILAKDSNIQNLVKKLNDKGKVLGAICAAPYALHVAGVLPKNYTCYPSFENKIGVQGYKPASKVVEEGNILTSRGPGTAMSFALYIVKKFAGEKKYEEMKAELLYEEAL